MADEKIKAGDVVQLKSGGPSMTVQYLSGHAAVCHWFNGNDAKQYEFYLDQLKKVDPNSSLLK